MGTTTFFTAIGGAGVALLFMRPGGSPAVIQSRSAVGAVGQPREHSHFSHFGGTVAPFSRLLYDLPGFRVDDSLVSILKYHPLVRCILNGFLALVGQLGGFEIGGAAQIGVLLQNVGNTAFIPPTRIVRVIVASPACALELNRTRCGDAPLFQHTGNFAGAVALRAKLKNQLYHRGRFFVHQQMAILALDIAVGGVHGQPLAGHSLVAENRSYLLRGVLGVPLVYDIAERGEVVAHLIVAVHSVIDGDKTDSHLWKANFRIQPYLQIVTAKPGHILNYHHTDHPRLNVSHHFLEAGALEAGAGIAVVRQCQARNKN